MLENLPQILGILGTLVGSLGGVALAQRHQRHMARLERAEQRRAELRRHIVAFLVNADEWASHFELMIAIVWVSSNDDMVDLTNSETFERAGRLRRAVNEELTQLIGLVGDDRLRDAVDRFYTLWLAVAQDMMGPVTDEGRKADAQAPVEARRHLKRMQSVVSEVRDASLPLVRVWVNEPQPIKWWHIRRWAAKRPLDTL